MFTKELLHMYLTITEEQLADDVFTLHLKSPAGHIQHTTPIGLLNDHNRLSELVSELMSELALTVEVPQ